METNINEANKRFVIELIAVILLLSSNIILYYKWMDVKQEYKNYILTVDSEKLKNEANRHVPEVVDREVKIYPILDAKITQINNNIKSINETVKRIEKNKLTKEKSYDTFKDKTIDEISEFLSTNSSSNTIISK